jgi:hypothetical protein
VEEERSFEKQVTEAEFREEAKREEAQLKYEENRYENIIASLSAEKLVLEQAILDNEEKMLYSRKNALKKEFQRRLRGK